MTKDRQEILKCADLILKETQDIREGCEIAEALARIDRLVNTIVNFVTLGAEEERVENPLG